MNLLSDQEFLAPRLPSTPSADLAVAVLAPLHVACPLQGLIEQESGTFILVPA